MDAKQIVKSWFAKWESGDFLDLPLSEDFQHTSPYGVITGRQQYLDLVQANLDKFLGHRFVIHDELYVNDRACVRYTALKDHFTLAVSEWHYLDQGLIKEIVAYYNIEGEIREARRLKME